MDAIQMLVKDHREAEELFSMYERAKDDSAKEAIVEKLCLALKTHMALEEEIFYPEARELLDSEEDLVDEAVTEHKMARKIMESMKKRDAGLVLDGHVLALKKAIEHHVKEEETEMFPKLQEEGMETEELGRRMAARRLQLVKEVV